MAQDKPLFAFATEADQQQVPESIYVGLVEPIGPCLDA